MTGVFLGLGPAPEDEEKTAPLPQGGVILGNTVVNGTFEDGYLAAFQVNAPAPACWQ